MTTPAQPAPRPEFRPTLALQAAVVALVRAYQDGGRPEVQAADAQLRDLTNPPGPDGGTSGRDQVAVSMAGQFMREWLQRGRGDTSMNEVSLVVRRLIRDLAPADERPALSAAVDQLSAGEPDMHRFALVAEGLPGHAGVHLLAAVTAAIIEQMPPTTHLTARVVLEQQRRTWLAGSQGIPAGEAAAYVDQRLAAELLLKVLPDSATMTGRQHEGTRLDLHALLQLYLLDHPFPTTAQEDAAVLDLIHNRLGANATAFARRARRSGTPMPRLSPEDQSIRQRAERERRQAKKKRRP